MAAVVEQLAHRDAECLGDTNQRGRSDVDPIAFGSRHRLAMELRPFGYFGQAQFRCFSRTLDAEHAALVTHKLPCGKTERPSKGDSAAIWPLRTRPSTVATE